MQMEDVGDLMVNDEEDEVRNTPWWNPFEADEAQGGARRRFSMISEGKPAKEPTKANKGYNPFVGAPTQQPPKRLREWPSFRDLSRESSRSNPIFTSQILEIEKMVIDPQVQNVEPEPPIPWWLKMDSQENEAPALKFSRVPVRSDVDLSYLAAQVETKPTDLSVLPPPLILVSTTPKQTYP